MTTLHQIAAQWSSEIWPLALNHLWQATLFGLLALGVTSLLRRWPANARYCIWLIALAKFALPSSLISLLADRVGINISSLFNTGSTGVPESSLAVPAMRILTAPVSILNYQSSSSATSTWNDLYIVLIFIWLAGSAVLFAIWIARRRQLSRFVKAGRTVNSGKEIEALRRVQSSLQLKHNVRFVISPFVNEPSLWRVWRPVVVLPSSVSDHLSEAELETVIMHELFHLKRMDNLFGNYSDGHPLPVLVSPADMADRQGAAGRARTIVR